MPKRACDADMLTANGNETFFSTWPWRMKHSEIVFIHVVTAGTSQPRLGRPGCWGLSLGPGPSPGFLKKDAHLDFRWSAAGLKPTKTLHFSFKKNFVNPLIGVSSQNNVMYDHA